MMLFVVLFGCRLLFLLLIFFFQAEDGIRDYKVTGVQTCALPISVAPVLPGAEPPPADTGTGAEAAAQQSADQLGNGGGQPGPAAPGRRLGARYRRGEIGRASCRERVESPVDVVAFKKKK